MKDKKEQKKTKISKSKYELTLAEFPLFLLSKGGKKNINNLKCIEYEDTISGKERAIVQRKWKAYPDGEFGFGTASTLETFFDLFQIWKENNFEKQYIQFGSIYRLLKRRQKGDSARDYRQIKKDLSCLVGIRIEAQNAFWDNELKAYVDMTFHLFDNLQLYKEKPNGQATLPFARIKASDVLYGSILKNSLLVADFDSEFFYNLTPVEQRLALYLSKIFRSQTVHKRQLLEFAKQIPIYAKQTKHIKERLKKACAGLIEKGFKLLDSFDFEKTADRKGELIIFKRKGDLPAQFKKNGPESYIKLKRDDAEVDLLVEDILAVCGDRQSIMFYKKVAKLIRSNTIYRAIAEVREVKNLGEMRRSPGAFFTSLIKKYAKDEGINL